MGEEARPCFDFDRSLFSASSGGRDSVRHYQELHTGHSNSAPISTPSCRRLVCCVAELTPVASEAEERVLLPATQAPTIRLARLVVSGVSESASDIGGGGDI